MKTIRQLLIVEREDVSLLVLFSLGVGVLTLATPVAVQSIVSTIALGQLIQPLVVVSTVLFICLVFFVVIRAFELVVVERLQRRLFVRTFSDTVAHFSHMDLSRWRAQHAVHRANYVFEIALAQKNLLILLLEGFSLAIQVLFGLIVLAFYHPYLLAFDLALVLALFACIVPFIRAGFSSADKESKHKHVASAWLQLLVNHPLEYRDRRVNRYIQHHIQDSLIDYLKARAHNFRVVFNQTVLGLIVFALASAALLVIGGSLVIQEQLTLGQLVASELILGVIVVGFEKLGKHANNIYDLGASLHKLAMLNDGYDRHAQMNHQDLAAIEPPSEYSLKVQHLSYTYDQHNMVIDKVSFVVPNHTTCLIVAEAGSGKTTLSLLLSGVAQPTQGAVLVGKTPLEGTALLSAGYLDLLRPSDPMLPGSLADNLRLGSNELSDERLRGALSTVGLEYLAQKPGALAIELDERGAPFSERERIQIKLARALLSQAQLVICDGAFDELDSSLSSRVLLALKQGIVSPRTVVVLSARSDLNAAVDRRWVLERGKLSKDDRGGI